MSATLLTILLTFGFVFLIWSLLWPAAGDAGKRTIMKFSFAAVVCFGAALILLLAMISGGEFWKRC